MNTTPYTPPVFQKTAFNCPYCGAYSNQIWSGLILADTHFWLNLNNYAFCKCNHCSKYTVWVDKRMIYPLQGSASFPNPDMPDDVRSDYEEANNILPISPRGATALLRLALQKLCKHLGGEGENINDDIGKLVKNGLPVAVQQALDNVRVIGNNAVHPGQIDLKDDVETATALFGFINFICNNQITQPKEISKFFTEKIPEKQAKAIEKRDNAGR